MKVSDLTSKTKAVVMPYEDDELNLVVRTAVITPKLLAEWALVDEQAKGQQAADNVIKVCELLIQVIASWDLMEGNKPFPFDLDRLVGEIPVGFQLAVVAAALATVGEAVAPADGAKKKPTSGATSLRAVRPA